MTAEEKVVTWTLLHTGVAELASLGRDEIDWQGVLRRPLFAAGITIYGKGGPFGNRSKRRLLPLSTRIQPLIENYFALNDRLRMTPRTLQRLVKRVANRARITRPVSPHILRHTFSVTAIRKGISLPALQRLLGHDRLTTTEIYLDLSPEDVVREYQGEVVSARHRDRQIRQDSRGSRP